MSNLKHQIADAITGMLYLSESERPLDLQEWGPDERLTDKVGHAAVLVPYKMFKDQVLAVDPADPDAAVYAAKWKALFCLLSRLNSLIVVRSGSPEADIWLIGWEGDTRLVVHTKAVET